jgi:Ca2+/Na+ antiporter
MGVMNAIDPISIIFGIVLVLIVFLLVFVTMKTNNEKVDRDIEYYTARLEQAKQEEKENE